LSGTVTTESIVASGFEANHVYPDLPRFLDFGAGSRGISLVMTDLRIARRLVITGRVQGVAYRAWTVRQARGLGLDGWVRNRRDGSVEALVAGRPEPVEELTRRCRRGPEAAWVEDVSAVPAEDPGPVGFRQTETV
jgi:acylphosphatase